MLRISQLLITTSILLGFIIPHLPGSIHIPSIQLKHSLSEGFEEQINDSPHLKSAHRFISKPIHQQLSLLYLNKNQMIQAILFLFLMGITYHLGNFLIGFFSLSSIIKNSIRLKKIGNVEIFVSERITIPFATQLLGKAHVVIPIQFFESSKNLKIAIQHELQHHRNFDPTWMIGIEILKIFFFCNPIFYFWRKKTEDLLELACDEALILKSKVNAYHYANCLLTIAENSFLPHSPLFGITGMAKAGKSFLSSRIQQIFDYPTHLHPHQNKFTFSIFIISSSFLFVTAFIAHGSLKQPSLSLFKINPSIQKISDRILLAGIEFASAQKGYAIVMDNQSHLLAISSCTLSHQECLGIEEASKDVAEKRIQPASIIKPIIMSYALKHDYIHHQEKLNTASREMTPSEIMIQSSGSGIHEIVKKIKNEELDQIMIEHEIRDYSIPKLHSDFALGKNIYLSPLEIVHAYRMIIQTSEWMKNTLSDVVLRGTGTRAKSTLYSTGGKTGTFYFNELDEKQNLKKLGVAQFVGFAPVENPKILVYVIVEGTEKITFGNTHAAPIFKKITEETLNYLKLDSNHPLKKIKPM